MAKKAKRRGRPPGSKSKKKLGRPAGVKGQKKEFARMEVGQLRSFIVDLEETLAAKIQQQREYLQGQIDGLAVYANNKAAAAVRSVMMVPKKGKRAKATPKYQSKQNKSQKWSGRGMLPIWMREEMKGTKLTKDDFLIK